MPELPTGSRRPSQPRETVVHPERWRGTKLGANLGKVDGTELGAMLRTGLGARVRHKAQNWSSAGDFGRHRTWSNAGRDYARS